MRYFYQSIYQDTVDALREIFNRLNLIIDGIACVRIADPEILRILKEKLDVDNIGAMSEEYIKNQISITNAWFQANKSIKTFDEFGLMIKEIRNKYLKDEDEKRRQKAEYDPTPKISGGVKTTI